MNKEIEIIPAKEEHYSQLLAISNESFLPKYNFITKNNSKIIHDLGIINFKNTNKLYAAVADSKAVGFISLKEKKQKDKLQPNISYINLLRKYGLLGVIRGLILNSVFSHNLKSDELYIEGVAVSSEARGLGVGTKLLNFVKSEMVNRKLNRLTLCVMYENNRAKKLYEKHGFTTYKSKNFRWLKKHIGYSGDNYMEYRHDLPL